MQLVAEKVKDLVSQFADAVVSADVHSLEGLLSENCEYQILDSANNVIEVKKDDFLKWFSDRIYALRDRGKVIYYHFDQCLHCLIGGPVVIFNDGYFPKKNDNSQPARTGLRLELKDGQITCVNFCYTFLKTENPYLFEVKGAYIKKLMDEEGLTIEEAMKEMKKKFDE